MPVPRDEPRAGGRAGGLIVETVCLGNSVKVTVVDPESLLEASVVGPVYAAEHILVHTAIRKLDYLRARCRR